jgi:transcriptional regulator with XRE-family HTH domain
MHATICTVVEVVRFGRIVRAIRRRRGWRQEDLAKRAGVSQSVVARIERGAAATITPTRLERVLAPLGARLIIRVDWQGEAADRLLDAEHAQLVEQVLGLLRGAGWLAVPEVTFAIRGDRGSVDILAWHESSATILVIEVKSVVPDIQGTLTPFDRKIRLAAEIGRERGWQPRRVATILVIKDTRTARRRFTEHAATFDARLPQRSVAARRFITNPGVAGELHAVWFLSGSHQETGRHRVSAPRTSG